MNNEYLSYQLWNEVTRSLSSEYTEMTWEVFHRYMSKNENTQSGDMEKISP